MTLQVTDMRVRLGRVGILDAVSLVAPAGSFTALVGPNGAGKSTLLRALVGALRPEAGSVRFEGVDLLGLPRRDRARLVALVEQQATTDADLTGYDVVSLGRIPHLGRWGREDADDALIVLDAMEAAGAAHLAERRYPTLSGGERQRVHIAAALAQQPRLLLVDEPTNHLDIGAQLDTLALLRRLARTGLTVVTAIHDLGHALAHADRVVAMSDGRTVSAGSPEDVLAPDLIAALYGVEADVSSHPVTGRPILTFRSTSPPGQA